MASKLMGSYSFIHLSVLDKNNKIIHVHSLMPPHFNPKQSAAVGIEIDTKKILFFQNIKFYELCTPDVKSSFVSKLSFFIENFLIVEFQ